MHLTKILGYGLTDINASVSNGRVQFDDYRINPTGYLNDDTEEFSTNGFIAHCKSVVGEAHTVESLITTPLGLELALLEQTDHQWLPIEDCILFDPFNGLSNVLIIVPPSQPNWTRTSDIIDVYQARTPFKPNVTVLDHNIFPYDFYTNKMTGEMSNGEMIKAIEKAKQYDITNQSWREQWNYGIPDIVIELCEYTKLFTDKRIAYTLVPMIYEIWR